jgi:hypothetical protein
MKKLLFLIITLGFAVNAEAQDEVFVVLVNKGECSLSRAMEKFVQSPEFVQYIASKKYVVKTYYGNDYPDYVRQYNVKWYPTLLKFRRNGDGMWVESGRIIGPRNLKNLLDFVGKRGIINRILPGST